MGRRLSLLGVNVSQADCEAATPSAVAHWVSSAFRQIASWVDSNFVSSLEKCSLTETFNTKGTFHC